jgi:hypothetical protein
VSVSLTPEYAVLVAAMRPGAAAVAVPAGTDWPRTLRAAEWHRLTALLAQRLAGRPELPADVRDALALHYLASVARSAFLRAALDEALAALTAAGVPAMLLKGAALTRGVYPDAAVREMLDLDLLVPAGALDAANAALAGLGYRRPPGSGEEEHTQGWLRAHHHHDPALVDARALTAIELHHHVAMKDERRHFDVADVWARARPLPGAPAHLLPAPEDLLLHAGFHFTRNRLGGSHERAGSGGALGQLADLAWIVDREAVDWEALAAATRAYRLGPRLFLALFAAREVGLAIPEEGLAALRPEGFDARIGRRLVALRVLRSGRKLPVRSLRWMAAPPRDVLVQGWDADPAAPGSLTRAYVRRARAQLPLARAALGRPWSVVHDYRLNGQIHALEHRE